MVTNQRAAGMSLLEVGERGRREIGNGEFCLDAAAIEDKQCRSLLAACCDLDLVREPVALFLAHAVRCEFFHPSRFLDGFFHVDREADAGIDPCSYLRVVRSIGGAGRALYDVAISRAEFWLGPRGSSCA